MTAKARTSIPQLATLIRDLAHLIIADSTHLQQAADELARLYQSSRPEDTSHIIAALQSSFRGVIEIALRIREEGKCLQDLKNGRLGNHSA